MDEQLNYSEFGVENAEQLKAKWQELNSLEDKYKDYDDVKSKYGEISTKYEEVNGYLEMTQNPSKFFADGEAGLKREALKQKFPAMSYDVAELISKGSELDEWQAIGIAEKLRLNSNLTMGEINAAIKEDLGIEDGEPLTNTQKYKLSKMAADANKYLSDLKSDIKIPELTKYDEYIASVKQKKEGVATALTQQWTEATGTVKNQLKSNPFQSDVSVEYDGVPYSFKAELAYSDEDLAIIDGAVQDMVSRNAVVSKEALGGMDSLVRATILQKNFQQVANSIALKAIEAYKQNFTNPKQPEAKDKPAGADNLGSTLDPEMQAYIEKIKKRS